jgi:hypothetical protein
MMGAFTKRQKEASQNHDPASEIVSQVARSIRHLDLIDENNWTISAANGNGVYSIRREGCKRICAVSHLSLLLFLLRLTYPLPFRYLAKAVESALTNSCAAARIR